VAVYRPKYKDKDGKLVPSAVWWFDFAYLGKRYRDSTHQTLKTLAREIEKEERRKAARSYAGLPAVEERPQRLRTVSEALKDYREAYRTGHRQKSITWVADRSRHLDRLLGSTVLHNLTEDRIRSYMETRTAEEAAGRSINMEVDTLARAIGRQWRELWRKVKRLEENHHVGQALSDDEQARLLTAAAASRSPLILPFLRVALLTAMRAGEIRTLRLGQLNWETLALRVGRAKTRAGTGREIPMNPDLEDTLRSQVARLREWFGAEPKPDWHLFPFSANSKPLDPLRPATDINRTWETCRKTAGIKCRLHDLRHTALTRMAETNVPEGTMLALAGHMSRAMLERYSHIRMQAKRDAVAALTLPKIANPNPAPKESTKGGHRRRLRTIPSKGLK
jgi:integrase